MAFTETGAQVLEKEIAIFVHRRPIIPVKDIRPLAIPFLNILSLILILIDSKVQGLEVRIRARIPLNHDLPEGPRQFFAHAPFLETSHGRSDRGSSVPDLAFGIFDRLSLPSVEVDEASRRREAVRQRKSDANGTKAVDERGRITASQHDRKRRRVLQNKFVQSEGSGHDFEDYLIYSWLLRKAFMVFDAFRLRRIQSDALRVFSCGRRV